MSWKKWMIAGWILLFAGAGCSIAVEREDGYRQENQQKTERQKKEERISRESEQLAEGFREIYCRATFYKCLRLKEKSR